MAAVIPTRKQHRSSDRCRSIVSLKGEVTGPRPFLLAPQGHRLVGTSGARAVEMCVPAEIFTPKGLHFEA